MSEAHDVLSVVVLISGRGSNFIALLDAQQQGHLPIRIEAVISNKVNAAGLEVARDAGIPVRVLSHKGFDGREAFDAALMETIDEFDPGLVILAGFMRILSESFVSHYLGRMINIHPSLLPDFPGLNTHQRALDAGKVEHGASVHFVTPEVDGGPLIAQAKVTIESTDEASSLATKVLKQEHRLFPMVVHWLAEGRLRLVSSGPELDGTLIQAPLILDQDISPVWESAA